MVWFAGSVAFDLNSVSEHINCTKISAGSLAFDLNSVSEHINCTKISVLSLFLKRFDGAGFYTLVTSRE